MIQPDIYWIKAFEAGHLAMMPRPRAGDWLEDEIKGLRHEGVDTLVSLLTLSEMQELELTEESDICQAHSIEFISFPIPDRTVPSSVTQTLQLCQSLLAQLMAGQKVAIHCRAGIGRSALIAACILVCAGISPTMAYAMVAKSRGLAVPDTEEQELWLDIFAQRLAMGY